MATYGQTYPKYQRYPGHFLPGNHSTHTSHLLGEPALLLWVLTPPCLTRLTGRRPLRAASKNSLTLFSARPFLRAVGEKPWGAVRATRKMQLSLGPRQWRRDRYLLTPVPIKKRKLRPSSSKFGFNSASSGFNLTNVEVRTFGRFRHNCWSFRAKSGRFRAKFGRTSAALGPNQPETNQCWWFLGQVG